jgi:hypothetical protein
MSVRKKVRSLLRVAGVALPVTAVVKELRNPPERRQWHGTLAGVVPYDFRPPTLERLRRSVWDPESDRLVVPQAFGVGWTVNLARVVGMVRSRS